MEATERFTESDHKLTDAAAITDEIVALDARRKQKLAEFLAHYKMLYATCQSLYEEVPRLSVEEVRARYLSVRGTHPSIYTCIGEGISIYLVAPIDHALLNVLNAYAGLRAIEWLT